MTDKRRRNGKSEKGMNRRAPTRRDFLRTSTVAAAGTAWVFGGSLAWGQVRWEDEKTSVALEQFHDGAFIDTARPVGRGIEAVQPCITVTPEGVVWIVWVQKLASGREELRAISWKDGRFSPEYLLSDSNATSALHPSVHLYEDSIAVSWVEHTESDEWRVLLRVIKRGAPLPVVVIEKAGVNFHPVMAIADERLWVLWESLRNGHFEIRAWTLEVGRVNPSRTLIRTNNGDCRRPTVAPGTGCIWIAWDQEEGPGTSNVHFCAVGPDGVDGPFAASHHPAMNHAPSIAVDKSGEKDVVWLAWHSNRRGNDQWDIPRWIYVARYSDGRIAQVDNPDGVHLDKEGTDQSFEFARILLDPVGRVVITGRPSHDFCFQFLDIDGWSPMYRVPREGWGGRGQTMEAAFAPNGDLWLARRDLNRNVLQRVEMAGLAYQAPRLRSGFSPIMHGAPALVNIERRPTWPVVEGEGGPYGVYYGDLHGHTWMSDGVGDLDEYFRIRKECYEDDFAALTDHDSFVGKEILPTEFEYQKAFMARYNQPGRFSTFFSQEWTTGRPPNGGGHIIAYSLDKKMPLFLHTTDKYDTTGKLVDAARANNCILIPHHTGWTGTQWAELEDPHIMPLVEICSNHGVFEYYGNGPIMHRGALRGMFIQDALARGMRFGLIGGSDSHGLIWHHRAGWRRDSYRGGLAGVLATENTAEALMEAMLARRTYATTGNKPLIDFRVNDILMGGEAPMPANGRAAINLWISARERIRKITIVRNNQDWHIAGGDGFTHRLRVTDDAIPETGAYYYARIEFLGPLMAWSSPVWFG